MNDRFMNGTIIFLALLLLFLPLARGLFVPPTYEPTQWPGQVRLWTNEPVTQTVQSKGLDVVGTDTRYLFYKLQGATVSGTFTITAQSQWFGTAFDDPIVITHTVGPSVTVATGMYTFTAPCYPAYLFTAQAQAGTVSATIGFVGQ